MVASMYAVYHGPEGLRAIATRAHRYAAVIAAALREGGLEVEHGAFFDTLTVRVPGEAERVVAAARTLGLHLRLVDADRVGLSTSETTTQAVAASVLEAFGVTADLDALDAATGDALPDALRRETPYLTHEVFSDPPHRDADAALPAAAQRARLRARPRHDPARLVHHEAQRHHRDGAGVAARVRRPAPVRAGRGHAGLPAARSATSRDGWPR